MKNMEMSKESRRVHRNFDEEMKERYGGKVWRLSLSSGCTCPNRDGTSGTGGCIFCSEGGSGEFAAAFREEGPGGTGGIRAQLEEAKRRVEAKRSGSFAGYMAYFQSFSGTHGDPERLKSLFLEAVSDPGVLALSVATRPDCLGEEILEMLKELKLLCPVTVELGLQTSDEETAAYVNRGYGLPVFEDAVRRLHEASLGTVVHVIAGLPGEDASRSLGTVRYLSELAAGGRHIGGIKIQILQILKGTRLAELYRRQKERFPEGVSPDGPDPELLRREMLVPEYSLERYTELVREMLSVLPEDVTVHRITGDPPKKLLLSPLWTADKKRVLNYMRRVLGHV